MMKWERLAAPLALTSENARQLAHGLTWFAIGMESASAVSFAITGQWAQVWLPVVCVAAFGVMQFGLTITAERHRSAQDWHRERLREQQADALASEHRAALMASQLRLMDAIDPTKASLSFGAPGVVVPTGDRKH